jgi:hypothetical protein
MNLAKDKSGVVLIFTLLIMSVLISVAISFSYFIISDINKARAIDNSIVAYYAADAGMEESLYTLKKQQSVKFLTQLKGQKGSGNLATAKSSWDIGESTDYETRFFRQRLSNGQTAKFFLLNRANTNGTKSIAVNWKKGAGTAPQLQVSLTQLKPQKQTPTNAIVYYTDTSGVEISDTPTNNNVPTCYPLKDRGLDNIPLTPAPDYAVEFKVLGLLPDDYVDSLTVQAYNSDDCSQNPNPTGITNLTLKSKGVYNKSNQYIIAQLTPKDTLSGLAGFVLFSEEDITKNSFGQ